MAGHAVTSAGAGRRRESPDVRRDQLLDAAERVLVERGLASATIADVAAAAGVAKGTLYLYFESRTELLAAMRARHIGRFQAALDETLTGPGGRSAADRLDRFVEEFFEYSMSHRGLHHLLFHQAGFSEHDAFAALKAQLNTFIAAGMASGDVAPADSEVLAAYLLAGVHAALVVALHGGPGDARRSLAGAKAMSRRLLATGPAA